MTGANKVSRTRPATRCLTWSQQKALGVSAFVAGALLVLLHRTPLPDAAVSRRDILIGEGLGDGPVLWAAASASGPLQPVPTGLF